MKLTATRFMVLGWTAALLAVIATSLVSPAYATKYGAGSYGRCQYQTCAISLASSTTVNINVTPVTGTTKCSVASDSVTVTTSSSTGYSLSLIDGDTATNLTAASRTIATSSGTYASPVALTANKWGYRLDNQGGFGAGPTSGISNGAIPTLTFAGIQPSSGTADRIVNATSAATNGVTTPVWYGVCVDVTQASGTYTDAVLYTALTN